MKELVQYRKELASNNATFIAPDSPHYLNHIEAMRHNATTDDQMVAVCCSQNSTYELIHAPKHELLPMLSSSMTFDSFEQLIHDLDVKNTVAARKLAYKFALGLKPDEIKSYTFAFECRIRYTDGKYHRTQLKYRICINGTETQSQLLMLELLPVSEVLSEEEDRGNELKEELSKEPSESACIVSINTRRVVLSNDTDQLTEREIEVMRLVKKGLSSTRIGEMLCISSNTVNNHRRSVLRKTHTVSTDLAIRYLEFIGVI